MKLPLKINLFELCHRGFVLEGKIPLKTFSRLTELIMDTQGEVAIRLEFSRHKQGQCSIQGAITATLMLSCQRCGNVLHYGVDLHPKLCPVMDDRKSAHLPMGFEPLLVTDEPISLVPMIEEELLLSLPMVPKHERGKCPVKLPDYLK